MRIRSIRVTMTAGQDPYVELGRVELPWWAWDFLRILAMAASMFLAAPAGFAAFLRTIPGIASWRRILLGLAGVVLATAAGAALGSTLYERLIIAAFRAVARCRCGEAFYRVRWIGRPWSAVLYSTDDISAVPIHLHADCLPCGAKTDWILRWRAAVLIDDARP